MNKIAKEQAELEHEKIRNPMIHKANAESVQVI
jgi:hypothetical protein